MSDTAPAGPAFKDRKTALVVVGILETLLGTCCTMMFPLSLSSLLLMRAAGPQVSMPQADPRGIIVGSLFYVAGGGFFLTIGIGTLLARRWARTLMLITSWVWLTTGLLACVLMAFSLPAFRQYMTAAGGGEPAGAAMGFMMAFMGATMLVGYVFLPGGLVLFYRSPHVKATCEHRDPQVRWTDRCPAPVLAASLLMGLGGLFVASTPIAYGVLPLFGLLRGASAYAIGLAIAGVSLFAAVDLYRQRLRGWWIAVVLNVVAVVSGVTFAQLDFRELYEAMGYTREWAERMAPLGESTRWWVAAWAPAWLAFLLWVRRYLAPPAAAPAARPPAPG